MAAIVRVKRRRDEDPANSIVLKCKKAKQSLLEEEPSSEECSAVDGVFKFAGTLPEKGASVCSQVKDAIRKDKLQKEYKQHSVRIAEKVRTWHKSVSDRGRYKIVAEKRAVDLGELDNEIHDVELQNRGNLAVLEGRSAAEKRSTDEDAEEKRVKKMYHLYDVVHDDLAAASSSKPGLSNMQQSENSSPQSDVITCNNVPMVRERVQPPLPEDPAAAAAAPNKQEYVYDIYYMNNAAFDFRNLENILAVEAFDDSEELYNGSYGEGREEIYDDEDDSNDEDNWRNDYPDDADFYDGADDYLEGGLGEEDDQWGITDLVHQGLRISGRADFDPDALSSDSDLDHAYFDEPLAADGLWTPATSYDEYMARVAAELGTEEEREMDG